jgi:8-oxo-dGTP pyrophosphatase MutT (NUDIX family)
VVPPLAHVLAGVLDDVEAVPTPAPEAQPVPAAVLVALDAPPQLEEPARRLGEIRVVLTKRRPGLRRHAGEISFPGGRHDEADADLSATALREAHEEIGLAPDAVDLVGALQPTPTIATGYSVYPFVGLIEPGQTWQLSPREVEAVLELPLARLRAGYGRRRLIRRGIPIRTDTYVVDGKLIWGATARILADLFDRIGAWEGGGGA